MDSDREKHISVTHFINPQLFWFHENTVPNADFHQIMEMEDQLEQYYKTHQPWTQNVRKPQVKMLVAAKFLAWQKMIRARVEHIANFSKNNQEGEFILWAIDYGFPFQTKSDYIFRLPDKLCNKVDRIRRGGLCDLSPAEQDFDFRMNSVVTNAKELWSQRACDLFDKLLNESESVVFIEKFKTKDHIWGDVIVTTHLGDKYNVRDFLIGMCLAMDAKEDFRSKCLNLKATKILPWMTNSGNSKFSVNKAFLCARSDRDDKKIQQLVSVERNDYAKKKVEDWCARNELATFQESPDIEADMLLGSITFDDSVSNINFEIRKQEFDEAGELAKKANLTKKESPEKLRQFDFDSSGESHKPLIEAENNFDLREKLIDDVESVCDEINEQKLGMAGALTKSRKNKYDRRELPPKPSSVDFDMSTESEKEIRLANKEAQENAELLSGVQSMASMNTCISSRKLRLLEKRKQMNKKQSYEPNVAKTQKALSIENVCHTKNNLIDLSSNASTAIDSDIEKQMQKTVLEDYENSTSNKSAVSSSTANSRHKQEESNTDSTSNTNEISTPQSSSASKRMERLRKKRLEHIKADMIETNKHDGMKEDSSNNSKNQNHTQLSCQSEHNAATTKTSAHISRLMNLRKKVKDIKKDSQFELTDSRSRFWPPAESLNEKSTFHGLRMIPAGFDITNLNHYKDEKNHWHRKATTRFDYVPHDSDIQEMNEEELTNHRSRGRHAESSSNQNKSILDTTVPKLNEDPIDFGNFPKHEVKSSIPKAEEQQSSPSGSNLSSPAPRKYGSRRSLKSPAAQINKIDEILRSAYDEKEGGNDEILDLKNLNSSGCKDESDNTELYSAEDGNNGGSSSGNEQFSSDQHSSNNRSLIRSRLQKKLTAQHAHLKHIEEQLTSELNGSKPESFRVQLPQVCDLLEVVGEHKLKTKFIDHLVLAHSKVPLTSLSTISEAFFLKEIHDEMENMRVTKLYRIQAYSWPHLLRGNSLFVVNPNKSGKTWSYLPAICSLVAYRIQSCRLAETYGPVAIILVATSAHVEVVHSHCKRLLLGVRPAVTTVPSYGIRNANDAKIQLLNSCGILIATPASLLRLLQDNENESLIDIERLKHFVIDDLDLMLSRSQDDIETVLKTFFIMSKRSGNKDTAQANLAWQLVVTSRDWDSLLVALMRKSNQPLLLIGDFLEAAVYGRVMISIKLCPSERKIGTILEFIEQNALENEHILVLCNSDDDVYEVVDALTTSAYVCIAYDSHASSDVRILIEEWKKKKVISSRIVVCADSSFTDLRIQNVSYVIHYSMPTSWTKFTARFSALAQTYDNYVSKNFDLPTGSDRPTARSLILLDEENSIQLPRLMDFMKRHDQLRLIHADILAVSKRVLIEREEGRILQGTRMCPYVLEFGECDEARCDFRHNLTRFDAVSKKDHIPTAGDIRILILKVFSPTHYAARLLQHRSPNSAKWKDIRRSKEVCNFSMQMNLHYLKRENWNMHWPLHIGDLCVYKYADSYQRARILELPDVRNTDIIKTIKLTVKLIDEGSIISSVKSDELFVCHDKFKEFPAQAINIRLSGVVPFDNERTWDTKATKTVQKWIMTDIKMNECVHVSINFTLTDTVWINNVIVMEQLEKVGQYVYHLNLKRSLLEKNIASAADCKRQGIREIAEELQLLASDDADATVSDSEMDFKSCSEHNASNLIKFSSNDVTMESEMLLQADNPENNAKEVQKSEEPTKTNGVKEEDEQEDWDAQLGANEIYLPLRIDDAPEKSDPAPTTVLSQIDQPDVLTTKTWKEEWLALPTEEIVKVEIGSEEENGNWGDIYLQHVGDEQMQIFDELLELTKSHVRQLQRKTLIPFPASWFKPMQNCIVHYEDRYLRAKLYGIFSTDSSIGASSSSIYRFFLCDYACFIMAKPEDLYNDFLYPTTKEIVEFTPYQAVHCSLAGIQLNRFAKTFKVTKDYLFAYAVKAQETTPVDIPDFHIKSYAILLYENETENDLKTIEMLNKALISNGVATVDEKTKHFLNIKIKLPEVPKDLCNFQELLCCIQRSFQLEMEEAKYSVSPSPLQAIEPPKLQAPQEKEPVAGSVLNPHRPYKPLNSKRHGVSSGSDEEPLLSSTTKTSSSSDNDQSFSSPSTAHDTTSSSISGCAPPPALLTKHKRPHVTWYDTDCFIYLVINAPDINDYYLEVTADNLIFYAIINDQPHALVLNFLGIVEPSLISHEIRGLNVMVRLVKGVFMKWPRLLQQSMRYPWITFNLNAIDLTEVEKLLPQQQLEMILQKTAALNRSDSYSSDESDDEERNLFQTFTPIINSEDIHDPTVEIF
ncbi:PREDICTED: putative ATP-dependent RNA helicase TDRD12 isoform X2 [Rhagoletis zephyria]|uniref:putative ATP-dependent RNA helicase TDRD12 isoform X2 n=1 Tax=Rhagoletis zephyria TaxID=28612 RepID=UPI00081140CF|nr:PREDICTED: putative ATP-dependent RNA helicase TDRD12 isoform X2 [Rhagoletis zephyria]